MSTTATRKPLRGKALRTFLDGLTILHGSHSPDGEMCVMEAVAFVAREPWSDHPKCASEVIGEFLRVWNDGMNNEDRQMLKPLIPKLINTAGTAAQERERSYMALDWLCRVSTPAWLRLIPLHAEAQAMEACAPIVDIDSARAARGAIDKGYEAAWAWKAAAWAPSAASWTALEAAGAAGAAGAALEAARAAGAGGAALRPTVMKLQESALDLADRMIAVTA